MGKGRSFVMSVSGCLTGSPESGLRMKSQRAAPTRSLAGMPDPDDFRVIEVDVPPSGDGEFPVRQVYLSPDPYQPPALVLRCGRSSDGECDMPH
jgi:hypothetical protein